MPLFWVSLSILLQASSPEEARLATVALESPRPKECRGGVGSADGLWLRAQGGDAQRFCDVLARGYARLEQQPADAFAAAESAQALAGPLPVVLVLNGRAALRLGRSEAALERFTQAEAGDARAFAEPRALHDYARAASLRGKSQLALRLYRQLVSQSSLLDDAREVAIVQIEVASQVLAYVPEGADEALGYLSQARRSRLGLSPLIDALSALARARAGHPLGARRAALPRPTALDAVLAAAPNDGPLLAAGEQEALVALLSEARDPAAARAHWDAFLGHSSPENLWLADARQRRAALGANKERKP